MTLPSGSRLWGPTKLSRRSARGGWARCTGREIRSSGREVAIKVLPESVSADPERLARLDYAQGFKLQADSLTNGLTAAQRAVEAAPSSHLAHCSLAQALS